MRKIEASDDRVHVITKENSGIVDALNLGLQYCTGSYVARQDADDLSYRDRFAHQVAYLAQNPDCVAVGAQARHIDKAGVWLGRVTKHPSPSHADYCSIPSIEPYILHPLLMVRREAIESAGRYRYAHHAEDTDLYWRLREIGRLHVLNEVLGDYRLGDSSITGKSALNGRLSAINSQLSALSARRREFGITDLTFPRECIKLMSDARTAEAIYRIAENNLTPEEAAYLRPAFAAKMMDLTLFRAYDLDPEDCRFIATALDSKIDVSSTNEAILRRMRSLTIAGLILRGHPGRASVLLNRTVALQVLAWLFVTFAARLLPMPVRRRMRTYRQRWRDRRPRESTASAPE